MSSARPVTAEEFMAMGEGRRELILGEVVELTPPGWRHGLIQARIAQLLRNFVQEAATGDFVNTESGYKLTVQPDTVRAPDIAVLSAARAVGFEEEPGYLNLAPDLAVEVVSPADSFTEVESRARMWLEHGSRAVWIVEPDSRRVLIYEPDRDRREIDEGEDLEGGEILPGFGIPVAKLFED
ncbi:MAG: Uma2 family endonuclease [Planctomycetota bacterium]|jgi:Uma2 family endonuclease